MSLFAIDEQGRLIHPRNATKSNIYRCIGCNEVLILRQGDIKCHHFAHYSGGNCSSSSGETYEHKYAKAIVSHALKEYGKISFYMNYKCSKGTFGSGFHHETLIYDPSFTIVEEYRMNYNGNLIIPDIAIVKNGVVTHIVEICHSHKQEGRPEPWYEFYAKEVIECFENGKTVRDIRDRICPHCIKCNSCTQFGHQEDMKYGMCDECRRKIIKRKILTKEIQCKGWCFTFCLEGKYSRHYERYFDCGQGCMKNYACKGCQYMHPERHVKDGFCLGCKEYGSLNKLMEKFCGYCKRKYTPKDIQWLKCGRGHYMCKNCFKNNIKCIHCCKK